MSPATTHDDIVTRARAFIARAPDFAGAAAAVVNLLAAERPHYKWTGVYMLHGDTLHLGPYVGAPTDHDRIPVGRGVCGTAVAENRNIVVHDVRTLSNYLACSAETRSEIVVLLRNAAGDVVGQIDVDGHEPGAFGPDDEALLDAVGRALTERFFAAPVPTAAAGTHGVRRKSAAETRAYRLDLNERILNSGFRPFKRFWAVDSDAYEPGALPVKTKELMGLAASLALRCNDCIFYHLDRCVVEGATRHEIYEALNVGLVVGGSITIPHVRYAFDVLDELSPEPRP